MTSSPLPGTNSTRISIAAQASESHLGSVDGSPMSGISDVMVDEKPGPGDNLDSFGLGPC